ncbi:MAG TPA: substrate-binding domain-containing protein [Planctomycetota bacterium]|nr:substrate-binding domain-containing protein [Planctomycetota bacterium]
MAVLAALLAAYLLFWKRGDDPLVVYCAHDSVYSERILRQFAAETGIPVQPVFDTEATKSLGLVERLIREKDAPRCDVFWNNELLGTLDLKERGITLPYKGSGYARIPDKFKDPDGHWTGFAARFRVWIVNTRKLAATEEAIAKALQGDLSRVAIAKPIYGTTLTHYTVLWHYWGGDKLKAWHKEWRQRGVVDARGNAHVKDLVADGVCDLGLTDTDDYFVAYDAHKLVAMVPFRLDNGATICIPNTVCIIRGTRHLAQAQRLVDYLLSEKCQVKLARSTSRQVPLVISTATQGPAGLTVGMRWVGMDGANWPAMSSWVDSGYPLATLGPARAECLAWLKSEYAK